ncbi:hypothetical protein OS493_026218 [Desmophyllum pertusum]|uniref:Uncharacterized protein n=1 Tax=Desmophyllum pertusum TaxID=174260 RepID=A0A9W9ZL26_9CNID|nr:hypothetical protein OS493_026218 [Desmophyllum pertusum]
MGEDKKEVEDFSEEHKELLQSYNVLQKEYGCFKEEFSALEKCLEMKSNDLQRLTEEKDLTEKRKIEVEKKLKVSSQENVQIRDELEELKEENDSQKLKLEYAEREIQDFTKRMKSCIRITLTWKNGTGAFEKSTGS